VEEVKKAAISVEEVQSVSEVQVYYKDSGEIACKVDIVLPPSLTIKQAHSIAGRRAYVLHCGMNLV
jgi:divalent metal cation (Fe/Co/Zn/Cd) transporter